MPNHDADCDGALTEEDCDDNNAIVFSTDSDADCDGHTTNYDCDDNNWSLFSSVTDGSGWSK